MRKMNKKGFTIVELVIVIAVIAILSAVLIPTFSGVVAEANETAVKSDAAAAIKQFQYDNAETIAENDKLNFIYVDTAKKMVVTIKAGQVDTLFKGETAEEEALVTFTVTEADLPEDTTPEEGKIYTTPAKATNPVKDGSKLYRVVATETVASGS